jgi:hypothetical protein
MRPRVWWEPSLSILQRGLCSAGRRGCKVGLPEKCRRLGFGEFTFPVTRVFRPRGCGERLKPAGPRTGSMEPGICICYSSGGGSFQELGI